MEDPRDREIPRRLRLAIAAAGLTHQALADKIGVDRSAVSQWATGAASPTIDNLKKAVEACEMSMKQFFGLKIEAAA